ncbi:MAG: hypothetical protein HY240_06225 [Actinobacteria bacterium]|nr:hypothetical protein [Actinomycetota bacterium]
MTIRLLAALTAWLGLVLLAALAVALAPAEWRAQGRRQGGWRRVPEFMAKSLLLGLLPALNASGGQGVTFLQWLRWIASWDAVALAAIGGFGVVLYHNHPTAFRPGSDPQEKDPGTLSRKDWWALALFLAAGGVLGWLLVGSSP